MRRCLPLAALVAGMLVGGPLAAQTDPEVEPVPAVPETGQRPGVSLEPLPPPPLPDLPGVEQLAEALADPERRRDALFTVATLMTLRGTPNSGSAEAAAAQAAELLDSRRWLAGLEARYGYAEPRSAVLDPAAWQVQLQLDRVGLPTTLMAAPLGPGQDVLLKTVFDRANPDLAAATLPELLWSLEANVPRTWPLLTRRLGEDPWLASALMAEAGDWLAWAAGQIVEPQGEVGDPEEPAAATAAEDVEEPPVVNPDDLLLERARESVRVMLELTVGVGPPDPERLADLRRELLLALPGLDYGRAAHAAALLRLASLADGLYEQQYLRFAEGLLGVTARMQEEALFYPEQTRSLAAWLTDVLPVVSESYGRAFASVDPRLNSVIATAFDVSRTLAGEVRPEDLAALRVQVGNAVAGLALLIPDLGFYFDQPIRDPIAGGVDACTGIAGQVDADGNPAMTRELFDDCQETLVSLAAFEARESQLAGSARGPFGPSELGRELGLTAGQRINYGLGFLHDRFETGCELPQRPLPNPLEWAYLATFMSWFAEQSPVYFQTPENEERLNRMREIGRELVSQIAEQVDCLAGAGAVLNDPVQRLTGVYAAELRDLSGGLQAASAEFRGERLAPTADIRLDGGARQSTAYRPAELAIGPCDPSRVCEMSGELSSTRALAGLFDELYLVADQSGLGQVEICYDEMGWMDRRMEQVREGDDNVANFYGRLAFDLRGRFREGDATRDLFAFRFTAPEESHYLFAAQQQEVLDDACPVEWIGTRIVTPLPPGRARIVPDRLTYLSAARTLPSRLLETNWEQGAEWRDWFVTGLGVERLEIEEEPDLVPRLDEHLRALYRQEQEALFGALTTGGGDPLQLSEEMERLVTAKLLLRTQMMLFYPHILTHSDRVREAMTGQNGLLDRRLALRARQADVSIEAMLTSADDALGRFRAEWDTVPEPVRRRGSIADSVSHAMIRLDAINDQFFSAPPNAPLVRSVAPPAGPESEEEQVENAEEQL